MNADDRLSLDPLGRVEDCNRIVECTHLHPTSVPCTHRANILGPRNAELRSGSVSKPFVHAIDVVTNLDVLNILADRREDSRST